MIKVNSNYTYTLLGVFFFTLLDPYFLWNLDLSKSFLYVAPFIFIIANNLRRFRAIDYGLFTLLFVVLLVAALSKRSNVFGVISMCSISLIPFLKNPIIAGAAKVFRRIYIVTVLLGLVVWVLLLLGVEVPHGTISPLNELKTHNYSSYPLLIIPDIWSDLSLDGVFSALRFAASFDEPGVVGTISFILLWIDKYRLRSYGNLIILISGLASFSLYFYVAFTLFFSLHMLLKGKYKFLIAIVAITSSCYVMTYQNEAAKELLWNRVEWDSESRQIIGNNRSDDDLDRYIDAIFLSDSYLFGTGNPLLNARFSESASYKNAILMYGAVSLALYMLFFSLYAFYNLSDFNSAFIFMLILGCTLYQRPDFYSIHYIFLFTAVIGSRCRTQEQ